MALRFDTEAVLPAVRAPKTAELIAARLRGQIVRGELRPGSRLPPEAELQEQFGVSRPTLREAFRILEAESLLTVRGGARGGAQVVTPDLSVAARHVGSLPQVSGTTGPWPCPASTTSSSSWPATRRSPWRPGCCARSRQPTSRSRWPARTDARTRRPRWPARSARSASWSTWWRRGTGTAPKHWRTHLQVAYKTLFGAEAAAGMLDLYEKPARA